MAEMVSDQYASKPHVVALAFVTQGHINALKNFCLALAANGVKVTFVTVLSEKLFSTSKQQQHLHAAEHEGFSVQQLVLKTPPETTFLQFFEALYTLEAPFEELARRLEPKVCCIISDRMYCWTQAIAKRLGVPRASLWTAASSSLDVDYHVPLLMSNGSIPVTELNKDSIISYLPGLPPLRASEIPFIYHAENIMTTTDPGYVRKIKRSVILKDDAWVFVNSFEEMEPTVFKALREVMNPNCIAVGPLLPPKLLESGMKAGDSDTHSHNDEADCLNWLNKKASRSVLYISFGSAVTLTLEEFKELSEGVEASQQAFIWALRQGGVRNLSNEAFESFKERNKSRGIVIGWAPQTEILLHGSTGVFVTHCGWNSVLDGICGGVPMLGWPKMAEQNLNCKILKEAGVCYSLLDENFQALRGEAIASQIKSTLADHEMHETAKRLRQHARKSIECSRANLQAFVTHLKNSAKESPQHNKAT